MTVTISLAWGDFAIAADPNPKNSRVNSGHSLAGFSIVLTPSSKIIGDRPEIS